MHLVAWPYNVEPWIPPGHATGTTRACFNSIAGSKDGIENLQSSPMSDPVPEIEHLYFFLIFKDLNSLR